MYPWTVPVILLIYALIIWLIVYLVRRKKRRNIQNTNRVRAKVIGKRMSVSGHPYTYTTYFVAFETTYGRFESQVDGSWYGVLIEGDIGVLTYIDNGNWVKFVRFQLDY